jgi:hypothetical protein
VFGEALGVASVLVDDSAAGAVGGDGVAAAMLLDEGRLRLPGVVGSAVALPADLVEHAAEADFVHDDFVDQEPCTLIVDESLWLSSFWTKVFASCCLDGVLEHWDRHLDAVELACNSSINASTGVTPSEH